MKESLVYELRKIASGKEKTCGTSKNGVYNIHYELTKGGPSNGILHHN